MESYGAAIPLSKKRLQISIEKVGSAYGELWSCYSERGRKTKTGLLAWRTHMSCSEESVLMKLPTMAELGVEKRYSGRSVPTSHLRQFQDWPTKFREHVQGDARGCERRGTRGDLSPLPTFACRTTGRLELILLVEG